MPQKGVNLTDLIDRLIDPRVPTDFVMTTPNSEAAKVIIDNQPVNVFLDLSNIGLVGPLKKEEVEFLIDRRELIAQKIKEAYEQASTNGDGKEKHEPPE